MLTSERRELNSCGNRGRGSWIPGAVAAAAVVAAAALGGGCGGAPAASPARAAAKPAAPAASTPAAPAASAPIAAPAASAPIAAPAPVAAPTPAPFDACDGSPPVPHQYFGILRKARCEQDMFLTMAGVAGQLGVECKHCHAPHPTDPKKEDYPVMTPKKEIANWMSMQLMPALKRVDGSPMTCKSCHVDAQGKPLAKILGNPRDPVKAQEWMSLVMVNRFVTAKGEKLRCKSCHAGNFSTAQWKAKVILQSEQIPPH
jgi:hypothetical protein